MHVAALTFLYANTLRRTEVVVRPWLRPRIPHTMPEVLSRQEVEALLTAVDSIKYRVVLMTTYGAGYASGRCVGCRWRTWTAGDWTGTAR